MERTEVRIRETVAFDDHRALWVAAALLLLLAELLARALRPRAP
jgi:hypothetical protein